MLCQLIHNDMLLVIVAFQREGKYVSLFAEYPHNSPFHSFKGCHIREQSNGNTLVNHKQAMIRHNCPWF